MAIVPRPAPAPETAVEPPSPVLHVTAFGLVLRGAHALISLLNLELLAHALGPTGRGEYFLFVAAVAVLARVSDLLAGMATLAANVAVVVLTPGGVAAQAILPQRADFAGVLRRVPRP